MRLLWYAMDWTARIAFRVQKHATSQLHARLTPIHTSPESSRISSLPIGVWISERLGASSLLLVGVGPGDPSEPGKKPFSHCVDGVGGGYIGKLGPAGGDLEAKEVLHSHQVGSRNTRSETVFTSHFFSGYGGVSQK